MSHVVVLEGLEITDLGALEAAAKDLGMTLKKKNTYKWYGTHVGDYPVPAGFNKADLGKCDYALSIDGHPEAYEVGVVEKDGQYKLLWDFWNNGFGLMPVVGKDCKILTDHVQLRAHERKLQTEASKKKKTVNTKLVYEGGQRSKPQLEVYV